MAVLRKHLLPELLDEPRTARTLFFSAIVLTAFALLLIRFHILYGYPAGDSTQYNAPWSSAFTAQLKSGNLYPRWLFDYPQNIGSPVFYFYGPLPFFVTSVLYFISPTSSITTQLTALHFLMYWLSGASFLFFIQRSAGSRFALVGALLYMGLPYHFLDLELRNALGEGFVYIWLPLIFVGLRRCGPKEKLWIVAAPAYAAVIYSHIPSAVLITPIMIIWTVVAYRNDIGRGLIRLCLVGLGGILLASPYLLPALGLHSLLLQDAWLADRSFLPESWLLPEGFSFRTGALFYGSILSASALAFGMTAWTVLSSRPMSLSESSTKGSDEIIATVTACLIGVGFIFFMISEPSIWLWLYIAPLRDTQFPFRLGVAADFLSTTAFIISFKIALAKSHRNFRQIGLIYVFIAATAASSLLIRVDAISRIYTHRPPKLDSDTIHCCVLPYEYWLPAVVHSNLYRQAGNPQAYQTAVQGFRAIESRPDPEDQQLLKMDRIGGKLRIHVDLQKDIEVRIAQAYFPLWSLRDISTGKELPLSTDPETGMILAKIPAASKELELGFKATCYETWGNVAALFGSLLLVGLMLARAPTAGRRESNQSPL
jgi:hypothetical protein